MAAQVSLVLGVTGLGAAASSRLERPDVVSLATGVLAALLPAIPS